MRQKFKWDSKTKTFIEITKEEKVVDPKAPLYMSDDMAPTESMATDKREIFTSKAKYRRHLKDHGYAICPINERPKTKPSLLGEEGIRELVKQAEMDVKYGRVEFTEKQKEIHLREERQWETYKRRQR